MSRPAYIFLAVIIVCVTAYQILELTYGACR
jgi:hypothetical protein